MNWDTIIFFDDPELQNRITQKLELLLALEKEVPAVIIVHSFPEFTVEYMSQRGLSILGVTMEEVRGLGLDYYSRFFNIDDVKDMLPRMHGLLERNDPNELISYFQQVRASPQHEWTWYFTSSKIFMHDNAGKPFLTLTLSVPIDAKHHVNIKVERLLQENNFLKQHSHIFSTLTKREKEILRCMALGLNSGAMGEKLFISEHTVNTHRRNIKSKLKLHTNYDVTRFAQAFDLI